MPSGIERMCPWLTCIRSAYAWMYSPWKKMYAIHGRVQVDATYHSKSGLSKTR